MASAVPVEEQSQAPASGQGDTGAGLKPKDVVVEAVEENPEFLRLKTEGNNLFKEGLFGEAISKYEEAKVFSNTDETLAALLHNIGYSYEKMDERELAVQLYSEALTVKPKYIKVLKRRSNLLAALGQHQEALEDMVDVVVDDIKGQKDKFSQPGAGGPNLGDFQTPVSLQLVEILLQKTELEAQKVLESHRNTSPPFHVVEAFLRSFYGDPVSRVWRGLDPSDVDDLISKGQADSLTGYKAALRDLKLKKYDDIVKHCTEEIENPDAEEIDVLNAHFLRGTMTFIWYLSPKTVVDFVKVTESPLASDEMKSSAFLKLGMRHTSTRHPFSQPSNMQMISEDYGKAEELWKKNPDVYFHGSLLLVDRGAPQEALDMLELGIKECDAKMSIMLKTFFWTLKYTISQDDTARLEAYHAIKQLEPEFDVPECHEMVAQALMASGGQELKSEYNEHFDKAIAFNNADPVFKAKKLIFRHWLGDNGQPVVEEEAVNEMYQFIEKEGPCNLAFYHIGQMEIIRGNIVKGLEAVDKSIELSGSIHEIEARVAAKLEILFHLQVNTRLKDEGLDDLAEYFQSVTFKAFPNLLPPTETPSAATL